MPVRRRVADRVAADEQVLMLLFGRSLPRRIKLQEIVQLLGATTGQTCLELTRDDGVMSYTLRKRGGKWHTIVLSERQRDTAVSLVGEHVDVYDGQRLPFEDRTFDAVVVVDFLERVAEEGRLIAELHRVLKPAGRMVVNMSHTKRLSLLQPLKQMLGVPTRSRQQGPQAYAESEVFRLLRDGFDVHAIRRYSRFFFELVDTLVVAIVRRPNRSPNPYRRMVKIYTFAYPFYWVAFQLLDLFLFFSRGHNMVLLAKRHLWRPRAAPVLSDGRSISEAVLKRAED